MRQIYKNALACFSSVFDHFLVYDIGRFNNKRQSIILWRWGWGSQECHFVNYVLDHLYQIIRQKLKYRHSLPTKMFRVQ